LFIEGGSVEDRKATVESLMNEHEAIRGHDRQVRELVKNLDSFLSQSEIHDGRPEYLAAAEEKRISLKQAMGYLEDGLKNHHEHEEQVMPPLVGELIMQAIRQEHDEMLKQFEKIHSLLVDNDIRDFLKKAAYIQKTIEDICQSASIHSIREDGILYFLKKAG
jgi:hypothetical protein